MQCLILWLFWFPGWWTILDTFGIGSKPQLNQLLDDAQNINWMRTYKIVLMSEHFSTLAAEIYHSCQSLVERSIFTPRWIASAHGNVFTAAACSLAQTWRDEQKSLSARPPCPPAMWQKIIVRLNNRPVVGTSTLTWTFSLFGSTTIYCLNCLCAKTQIICLFFMSWQRWCYLTLTLTGPDSSLCPGKDDVIWVSFQIGGRGEGGSHWGWTAPPLLFSQYQTSNCMHCNQSFREKLCSTEHYFCWRPATGSKLHNMMGASINLESIPGVELWTLSQQPRTNISIPCNICANFFRSRNQFWLLTVLCQLSSENQNDLPIAWWGRLCLKVSTFIR